MVEVSVVVATYNRAGMLRECLRALSRQTVAATDFEVIVVDDGSRDDTAAVLDSIRPNYRLLVVRQANQGQAAAQNAGVARASAPYVLCLDDDILPEPGLIAAHLAAQRAGGPDGVVALGRIDSVLARNADPFARQIVADLNTHYARADAGEPLDFMDCYSGNLSVPRAAFLALGGFASDLPSSHDVEFGYRLARYGLRFVYVGPARSVQQYTKGWRQILAEDERGGTAGVALYRRHPPLLERLELGIFTRGLFRRVLARRILLALNLPPGPLAQLTRLLPRDLQLEAARFVRTLCYWRGVRRAVSDQDTWERLTSGTAILMYHAFGESDTTRSKWIVSRRQFGRHMTWLRRRGYCVIGLDAYVACRLRHQLLPARSVVITIDDGYLDTLHVAEPVLRKHGFTAAVFLVSRALGGCNDWDVGGELRGRRLLSVQQVKQLLAAGLSVGGHSRTHPRLTSSSQDTLRDEIEGCRVDLEQALSQRVDTFAYPYGEHDAAARVAVQQAGFTAACGTHRGLNDYATPLLALRRVELRGTHSLLDFALAVVTGNPDLLKWR